MTLDAIKLRRLAGQHLLAPADAKTVVQDLCGIQAQYLSHALRSLSLRCQNVDTPELVKTWTLRGTMHLICREELPLFLHEGRSVFLRPVDTMDSDSWISSQRKAYFADLILDSIGQGLSSRKDLKAVCVRWGMTDSEALSLFDPWGGIIRALCHDGRICHRVSQEKSYQLCPPFTPMDKDCAQLELARRYFSHFGPATVKDSAYFFGCTQREVKGWLSQLPVEDFSLQGRTYFSIPGPEPASAMPRCLFLAGFDPLLLGYEKTESLFLPRAHLRSVYTLSGIVRPTVLVDGNIAGCWNLKNRHLTIQPFGPIDHALLLKAAELDWPDLKKITIV